QGARGPDRGGRGRRARERAGGFEMHGRFKSRRPRRRLSMPLDHARPRLEVLEDRTAPAIVGPQLPSMAVNLVALPPSTTNQPQSLTSTINQTWPGASDGYHADPTVTTISWGGRSTLAKVGEWIVRFDGVTGSTNDQLGALQAKL